MRAVACSSALQDACIYKQSVHVMEVCKLIWQERCVPACVIDIVTCNALHRVLTDRASGVVQQRPVAHS